MVLLDPALIGESFVHLGGNPASLARRRPSRCAEKTQLLVVGKCTKTLVVHGKQFIED